SLGSDPLLRKTGSDVAKAGGKKLVVAKALDDGGSGSGSLPGVAPAAAASSSQSGIGVRIKADEPPVSRRTQGRGKSKRNQTMALYGTAIAMMLVAALIFVLSLMR